MVVLAPLATLLAGLLLLAFVGPTTAGDGDHHARGWYHTWTVTAVTGETITLSREKADGSTVTVTLDRARRPELRVGDRVRYDPVRNRLRRTLPPATRDNH